MSFAFRSTVPAVVGFELGEVRPSFMQKYHPSTLRWPLFHQYFKVQE
jgi:hypothetical protein